MGESRDNEGNIENVCDHCARQGSGSHPGSHCETCIIGGCGGYRLNYIPRIPTPPVAPTPTPRNPSWHAMPLVAQFTESLEEVVNRYRESGISVAEAVGALERVKQQVIREAMEAEDGEV